jgi:hypothetical protein
MAQLKSRVDGGVETMSAREANDASCLMIDKARAESVLIEKHGHCVVMVISVEELKQLSVRSGRADKYLSKLGPVTETTNDIRAFPASS